MLSIGDGIAVFGGLATASFTLFRIIAPSSKNTNGFVSKEVCTVQHTETNRRLDRIEHKLDQALAGHGDE